MRRAGCKNVEHVLDVDHADDGIERAAINRQAAVPGLGKQRNQIGKAGLLLHRHNVRARHADIATVTLAEMQQVAHHLPLQRGQVALGIGAGIILMRVDHFLDLGAQAFIGFPENPGAEMAPKAALGGAGVAGGGTLAVRH